MYRWSPFIFFIPCGDKTASHISDAKLGCFSGVVKKIESRLHVHDGPWDGVVGDGPVQNRQGEKVSGQRVDFSISKKLFIFPSKRVFVGQVFMKKVFLKIIIFYLRVFFPERQFGWSPVFAAAVKGVDFVSRLEQEIRLIGGLVFQWEHPSCI